MTIPKPWSREKRIYMQDRIAEQAERCAKQLKAKCCVVIAMFEGDDQWHILEGGKSVMPLVELYQSRADAQRALADAIAKAEQRETLQ